MGNILGENFHPKIKKQIDVRQESLGTYSNIPSKDLIYYQNKTPFLKLASSVNLESKGKNTETVWKSILVRDGSVQHLNFLDDHEKDVFKTFSEVSQKEIVIQASQRQKHIDQGQSLNLMVHPKASPKEVSDLMIFGWEMGLKGFYYQRSTNPSQALAQSIMECTSCEG